MHVMALLVGTPAPQIYDGKSVLTSGHKTPVAAARLRQADFEGNAQADLKHHGGPDKAVCVYSFDHYAEWERLLGRPLTPGAFSENLCLAGIQETEVCLGDIFEIGSTRVQISQPRQPCFKLAGRMGRADLPALIHANHWSGFYFRVLMEGQIAMGDPVTCVAHDPAAVTVDFANAVMYRQRAGTDDLARVLAVEALSTEWRHSLSRRMA